MADPRKGGNPQSTGCHGDLFTQFIGLKHWKAGAEKSSEITRGG